MPASRRACTSSLRLSPWRRPSRRRSSCWSCWRTWRSTARWPTTGRCTILLIAFTALLPNGKLPDDETAKLYTVTPAQYTDGEAPRAALSGFHYEAVYGSGENALKIADTIDGWTVLIEPQLNAVTTDSQGTIDYTLAGINVSAKCTPIGLSEAEILAMLPVLRGRGRSTIENKDLVISSKGGLTVSLKNASLVTGPLNWGSTALRVGELGFTAHIDAASGVLFSVDLATPNS